MTKYNVRVETIDHEFINITVAVVPVMQPSDYSEQFWVIYPTELYGIEIEVYNPEDIYTLRGFIKHCLLEEYEDVIWIETEE